MWLLLIAPGQMVTLHSPLTPDESLRRLRAQTSAVKALSIGQVMIHLPVDRTQRRFFAWIENDPAGGTRISGQTRTPYRVAVARSAISMALFWLAMVWLAAEKPFLGFIFIAGSLGFLLLSQYERMVGRDRRQHVAWLRRIVKAD